MRLATGFPPGSRVAKLAKFGARASARTSASTRPMATSSLCRDGPERSVLVRDEEGLRGEPGDDARPVSRHDHLLFDPRARLPVRCRAVRLEGEDHPFLDLRRALQRVQSADD